MAGFHWTYIGQIERGEKNLGFTNLAKVSNVLGVTMSQLLMGLEDGSSGGAESASRTTRNQNPEPQSTMLEVRKLVGRLGHQGAELEKTIQALELMVTDNGRHARPSARRKR